MKAKVYLKMLACLVGLLTFYSCNNDLEQDKNASVEAQQVQNGQEVSLQENAYADYLELMKSLNSRQQEVCPQLKSLLIMVDAI